MEPRGGPQHIPRPDRWRLGAPSPWAHLGAPLVTITGIEAALEVRGEGTVVGARPTPEHRRSAVLVALYEHDEQTWVVLTRRSPQMRSHTHQVSFPGGRVDPTDTDDWATACREAHEEVDLHPSLPRRIGQLDAFIAGGSQVFVTPIVAELPRKPVLTPNPTEVEHILHVPLSELLLPEVFREELWTPGQGQERAITFFELRGDTVWGATAAMLRQLLAIATGTDASLTR